MTDESVAYHLRSDAPLVVIEAPAGTGKTYQGASYARDVAPLLGDGRLLILTHTHAACSVFADRTHGLGSIVEIKTMDGLIYQIARLYHQSLGLPQEISAWAWRDQGAGFAIIAERVARLLNRYPMIAGALSRRYPVVICDEHQDTSADQHSIVMSLHSAGSRLRVFGDPMQRIYGEKSAAAIAADRARWDQLLARGIFDSLDHPHRWEEDCRDLGVWVLAAREKLMGGQPIDLSKPYPPSVSIQRCDSNAQARTIYSLPKDQRRPLDRLIEGSDQMMILAPSNEMVAALRSFWGRRIPLWEGHTREALSALTLAVTDSEGDARDCADALVNFVGTVCVGFSTARHWNPFREAVHGRGARQRRGLPGIMGEIAQQVVDEPNHKGVAKALKRILHNAENRVAGFKDVKLDHPTEFHEAIRLGQYEDADEGFADIARKRTQFRGSPKKKVITTIHKAKGLECENSLIITCGRQQFGNTYYARCKLYVALSRAKHSVTLVIPRAAPSPLFRF